MCIEGFPRSANSFLTLYFMQYNKRVEIAHHLHLPMQYKKAVSFKIPTIVLLRHPLDAITSLLIRERFLYPSLAIISYIWFYKALLKYTNKVLIVHFKNVISAPDEVIDRLNKQFNSNFHHVPLTGEMKQNIFTLIDQVDALTKNDSLSLARPTQEKDSKKEKVKTIILQSNFYPQALNLYYQLVKYTGTSV
ncbi:MAG: hypothetical protein IPO21_09010 [Bacteroidales bacterium]|nr:hypothetical protein [Bacteroidales bacterium]